MSYKSIDLQTSLPRTAELSPLAHQQQHRSVSEQAMLAQQTVKHAEEQGRRMTKTESSSQGKITDQQPRGGGRQSSRDRKGGDQEPESEHRPEHPFKGKHIDYSG